MEDIERIVQKSFIFKDKNAIIGYKVKKAEYNKYTPLQKGFYD